jgi:surface antigen
MADLGTAAKLVEVALAEVGTVEGPKDNQTKYGAFTKANFQPWCGSFVMWCGNQAGVKVPNTVYTPGGAEAFTKQKRWYDAATSTPEPGDIVYFDFPGDGVDRISHVGIVVKDNKDGTMTTIEGNTAGNAKGDQRNGGECCKKVRAYRKDNKAKLVVGVVGWGRPDYTASAANPVTPKEVKPIDPNTYPGETIDPGESGPHVKTVQTALGIKPADGVYGPVTKKAVIAFQKANPKCGAPDGIIGPVTWKAIVKSK